MGHGHNKKYSHRCVILHNLIIEDDCNCNLKPLFDVGFDVSHLKTIVKEPPKLKMWVSNAISKMTFVKHLWAQKGNDAIFYFFCLLKKNGQHPFINVIHMFIDNIPIIDTIHFLREIKHFQKPI
jgi:hypothetical protein